MNLRRKRYFKTNIKLTDGKRNMTFEDNLLCGLNFALQNEIMNKLFLPARRVSVNKFNCFSSTMASLEKQMTLRTFDDSMSFNRFLLFFILYE